MRFPTEAWNEEAWCGITTWVANQPKDVHGRQCGDTEMFSVGHVQYQIYRVKNDQWHLGDSTSGTMSSDATRPSRLGSFYLSRQ